VRVCACRIKIWEVKGIVAIIPNYTVDKDHPEHLRPYPTPQYPSFGETVRSSHCIRLGPNAIQFLHGHDRLENGVPVGMGWGAASNYAGSLNHLGSLLPLTAQVMARLCVKFDAERDPKVYQNGQYSKLFIVFD
jgi:hypothetical protein